MPMTATRSPLTGGRLASVIAGGFTLLLAGALVLVGGGLQWAASKRDDAGYFSTRTERISTPGHAVATADLDLDGVPAGLGTVRLDVGARTGTPVFAGVARTRDLDAYLRGSAHATLTDVDFDPFDPEYRLTTGSVTPARPADQRFWAATSDGVRPLDWKVRDGNWSVVVMNADGSAGVDADVRAGATVPLLDDVELAAWIGAALLLALGGGLLAAGLSGRRQPSWPAGSASGA